MLLFPNLTVYYVDGAEESISAYYLCLEINENSSNRLVVNKFSDCLF